MVLMAAMAGALVFVMIRKPVQPPFEISGQPTDFSRSGTIVVDTSGPGQATMKLVYEEPGKPALTANLELDGLSVCATSSGALPCMAMSVTFDVPFHGKRAIVQGIRNDGAVLVRKLQRLEEGQTGLVPAPGAIFIPWVQAVQLFERCQVKAAIQAHSLDIFLTLKDDRSVVAIEPTIDEVFSITDRTRSVCGDISLGTE